MSVEAPKETGTPTPVTPQRPEGSFRRFLRKLFDVPLESQHAQQPMSNFQVGLVQIQEQEKIRMKAEAECRMNLVESLRSKRERDLYFLNRAKDVAALSRVAGMLVEAEKTLRPFYPRVSLEIANTMQLFSEENRRFGEQEIYERHALRWSNDKHPLYSVTVLCYGRERSLEIIGKERKTFKDGEWQNREDLATTLLEAVKSPRNDVFIPTGE